MKAGHPNANWSEAVEDLVDAGDLDGAVGVLESVLASLRSPGAISSSDGGSLRLAAALGDLADLHDTRGRSLQADGLREQALLLRNGADLAGCSLSFSCLAQEPRNSEQVEKRIPSEQDDYRASAALDKGDDDDDWETIADRRLPEIAGSSSIQPEEEARLETAPKRRGRGFFLYQKDGLYSDLLDAGGVAAHSDSDEDADRPSRGETADSDVSRFGTGHVLVLSDFPPSTRTTQLEKLFEGFRDQGFAIRWIHDTCALAVFRTPSIASEARNAVPCPFQVRALVENDKLFSQISKKDLEPPYPRPKTSAKTARRLIAQGMGLKLHSDFGRGELRIQEEAARKDRIRSRQAMKDDAWGSDDP